MKGFKNIFLVFKFFMVLVYLALGVAILFFNVLPLPAKMGGRTFFGIVFIIYGLYRSYTIYKSFKERDEEE